MPDPSSILRTLAKELTDKLDDEGLLTSAFNEQDYNAAVSIIEAALIQAQQAQRERDAQIAEEVGPWHYGEGENVGQAIAAAIRSATLHAPEIP